MRSTFFRKQPRRQSLAVAASGHAATSGSSTTRPTWIDKARRDLGHRLRQELCRQAAPTRHRAGRQFQSHRLNHHLRLHHLSDGWPLFRLIIELNGCNGRSRHAD
ncbi:hypothetical protein [Bradyrhizobium sp. CCBAU 051011]|uniref:hypothetical protein n=1 Tax=Bradyrhizobium sp. CCBAU 051011 TaxID=858422 RepID=UPI003529FF12